MNENKLEQEAILITDADEEVSLGNFHIEEDPEIPPEDEKKEEDEVVSEFLEINVQDSVMSTSVGPGQL